ncbi:MAG: hypothetical protein QM578_25810 [Pantoea sp.]|uniref:hypothetical protein n=1 Tax=Pantoea sp. TaxID=69393 RepID=UPI0039E5C1B1
MSELELAEKVRHFYFCLILALNIHNKQPLLSNEQMKRRFILNWLKTAKSRKLFNPVVAREIDWLIKDMTGVRMQGIEPRLMYIYEEIVE